MRPDPLVFFLDTLPEVLVAQRLEAVRARLRAERPRHPRRIFARATEQAVADASVLCRLVAITGRIRPTWERQKPPPAALQRRLNAWLVERERVAADCRKSLRWQ